MTNTQTEQSHHIQTSVALTHIYAWSADAVQITDKQTIPMDW